MSFTVHMKADLHKLRLLNTLAEKTFRRWKMLAYRIVVLGLTALAGWSAWNGLMAGETLTGIFKLITALFLLIAGVIPNTFSAWLSQMSMIPDGELQFDETGFTEVGGGRRVRHRYAEINDLVRFRGCDFIFLDQQRSLIVPPDCFTKGDADVFHPFLEERCGKIFREIK